MGFSISQEDVDGGSRVDYDAEFAMLEDALDVVFRSLADLGVTTHFAFAIEDGGEEKLAIQFEPQGDDGLKPRRLVISATGESKHWPNEWLEL